MAEKDTNDTPKKAEPKWWARFLATLASTGNVLQACKAAGIRSRKTAYRHRERYPVFARRWDDAIEDSNDLLETEARRRAHDGVDDPVYYKDERIDVVKKYSDTLLMFLMKANRPEKYRDNYDIKKLLDEYLSSRPAPQKSGPGNAPSN